MPSRQLLSLTEDLTIYHALEQKNALLAALGDTDELELDLMRVGEIDTAGLQLMLIAKRYPGKTVLFTNHPPVVLRLVDLANLGGALGDPLLFTAAVES